MVGCKSGLKFVLVSAWLLSSYVLCAPDGAPLGACETMTPGHGPEPQNSTAPFTTVPQSNSIDAGSSVELILSGTETFRGFLVLALSGSVAGPVGTFSGVSDGRTLDCSGTVASGATHSSRTDKSSVSVTWTPPQDFNGSVVFHTTFVHNVSTYWVAIPSTRVTVTTPSVETSTATNPQTETSPATTPTTEGAAATPAGFVMMPVLSIVFYLSVRLML